MNPEGFNFPIYATQGGGLAKEAGSNTMIFITDPGCPGLQIGDFVPKEWGTVPANAAAVRQMER